MKHRLLSAFLLVLIVLHNNAHKLGEWKSRGQVFNVTGHLLIACLLGWLAYTHKSAGLVLVCALGIGYALQVAGCSAAWLWQPWQVTPGGDLCSDGLKFPLGLLGLTAALLVAAHLAKGKP